MCVGVGGGASVGGLISNHGWTTRNSMTVQHLRYYTEEKKEREKERKKERKNERKKSVGSFSIAKRVY